MVVSLLKLTSLVVVRKCDVTDIFCLLSLQLSNETYEFVLSHIPLNQVFAIEKENKDAWWLRKVWNDVIDKCSQQNLIFNRKLLKMDLQDYIDCFDLQQLQVLHHEQRLNSQRQLLINILFAEALSKSYHADPRFDFNDKSLNKLLQGNTPNVDNDQWLLVLSSEIDLITLDAHQVEYFLNHPFLQNIFKHICRLKFCIPKSLWSKLDCRSCPKFLCLYQNLCQLLYENVYRELIFLPSTSNFSQNITLLKLLLGKVDKRLTCFSQDSSDEEVDLWDDALAINHEEFIYDDNEDENMYYDFAKKCDEQGFEDISRSGFVKQLVFLTKLSLDFYDNQFALSACGLEIANVLSCAISLKELDLRIAGFLSLPNDLGLSLTAEILLGVKTLVSNISSNLSVLKLSRGKLNEQLLVILYEIVHIHYKSHSREFEKICLIDCEFIDCNEKLDALSHTNFSDSLVKMLHIQHAYFHEEGIYLLYLNFSRLLHPSGYAVVGSNTCGGNWRNVDLLCSIFNFNGGKILGRVQSCLLTLDLSMSIEDVERLCFLFSNLSLNIVALIYRHKFDYIQDIVNAINAKTFSFFQELDAKVMYGMEEYEALV